MQKKNDHFKPLFLLLFTTVSLFAQAQKKFELKGKVSERDGQLVQLVRDYYGNASVLATDTVRNGQFHLSTSVEEIIPVYVTIRAGKQTSSFSVILEPGKMNFILYPSGRKAVTGGKYNKLLFGYESQPEFIKADDAMRANQKKGLENIKDPQENYEAMQVFLKRNELRSYHLQKVFNTSKDLRTRVMAAVLEELQPDRLKSMELVNQAAPVLGENSLLIQTARKMNQNQEMSINMRKGRMNGQAYIDFTAASLKGDSVQLSKLLGSNKYTLLQFWASWCVPCRHEIPLLKKLYNSNQEKGFGIVAFSLDENKFAWTKASEKENFVWPNISDLKGFTSNIIKQYQVSGIPANVIIDQQGKIVASNLVGDDLEKKIEELMK
ncbi:TlpA disulfide reductase family protein [Pseudobacter ginsenosidimutans]|uniref:Thiol-disulfide isomerase/thioredoxin n=1 Tax=Pseudobacter ginsenosidimutans TaxID=661488 RepID=A0A4Q7MIN2_9BACT|nr:TlpA disulfide reductase family protein [Pseudobacter ginsenosidimutans]QEC45590.1 AhpC/TSA family protein [Pseudobacter ginsenosidimutans]RZS67138.1 thiol-disulfide isomerase/thioredoxin [Pseudobacter ginsenosidimutans]